MPELVEIVSFRSDRFAPILPEDSQVNPEVYGAELAWWLTSELAAHGVITSYPIAEDWGWFIEYSGSEDSEFALHCYNVDGSRDRWLLALRPFGRRMFGRDRPDAALARPLLDALRAVLGSEPTIGEIEWIEGGAN